MTQQELYSAYRDKVLAYFFARVKIRQDAEDLCEDVFEQACRSLPRYDPAKATMNTWIFTIARYTLINYFQRSPGAAPLHGALPDPEDPETTLLREETLSRLAAVLAAMEQDKRDIIVLRYYKGYSLTRISQLTGISYGMVKVKHKKALETLRRKLA